MGSGGDGYCDLCRSTNCKCNHVEPDGELFGVRRWASWAAAVACFKTGSAVMVRVRQPRGDYLYRLLCWRSPETILLPAAADEEYLLVASPGRPYLPIVSDDLPTRKVVRNFWKQKDELSKWVVA